MLGERASIAAKRMSGGVTAANRNRSLSKCVQKSNNGKSRIRARVEPVFGVIKNEMRRFFMEIL